MTKKKDSKPEKKHTAMKLPASTKPAHSSAPGGGKSWESGSGKPHKTPEHLMGKARKVH